MLFVNGVLNRGQAIDYVDDKTVVYKQLRNGEDWKTVERELSVLREMLASMSQSFSPEKSVYMIFNNKRSDKPNYNTIVFGEGQNRGEINRVEKHKVLGIVLEESLGWNTHISELVKKLGSYGFAIYRMRNLLNTNDIIKLYHAFVYSVFKYGIIFWGNASESERVFKVQKRIVRNIFGLKRRESCRQVFKKEGIMTMYSTYIREAVLFVNKNRQYFLFNKDVQDYKGRRGHDVRIAEMPKGMQWKSPKLSCAQIYNKMPAAIKDEEDPVAFKRKVTEFCKTNVFYSWKEL